MPPHGWPPRSRGNARLRRSTWNPTPRCLREGPVRLSAPAPRHQGLTATADVSAGTPTRCSPHHPTRRERTPVLDRPGGGSTRPAPAGPARSRWSRGRRRARQALGVEQTVAAMGRALFPAGEPPLPEAVHVNGERMDLRYAVGVLTSHRDLVRRLAAEAGVAMSA
jgi:hypothetical protein